MRSLIIKLSAILISILIALLIGELIFRALLFSNFQLSKDIKDPSLFTELIEHQGETIFTDDYFKLRFLFDPNYSHQLNHSTLGWMGSFYGASYRHFDEDEIKGRRPVRIYGDSFAHCIDSTTCFEEFLNQDTSFNKNHYFLNYGVGGYGVDQISILLDSTIDLYEKPFVVLSLLTYDLDRSMLKFRDAQKPYFELANNSLDLKAVPLYESNQKYVDENPPAITSYLWNRFKSSDFNFFEKNDLKYKAEEYVEHSKQLNTAIIDKMIASMKERNIDFVFLIFHKTSSSLDNWRLSFLRQVLSEREIPYFVDRELYHEVKTAGFTEDSIFTIVNDGHPTTTANSLVAQKIKDIILDKEKRERLTKNQLAWRDPAYVQLMVYEEAIVNDQDWFKTVAKQAVEKGIPIDSSVYLNARYMLESESKLTLKDIHFFKNQIKNSDSWLNQVEQKAIEKNISLDSMIQLDAEYMYDRHLISFDY